jgi:UDP-glucose:(heptosyl)LPS alpha-1,3-glucosyltransferase
MKVALLKMRAKSQGGLEKYASRIASAFVKKGADVTLLTTQMPEKPLLGIKTHAFPICKWPGFLSLEQFDRCAKAWLKKTPVDIVFGMERNRFQTHIRAGNGVHAAYLKSRLASEGRFKYGMCLLNPLHRKILELEKAAFENKTLKKIFVNSRMVESELLEHYAVDPGKIEVIHNGVEWEEHESSFSDWQNGKEAALKRFGLDGNVLHLLFIGHGYRRKGLDHLLNALSIWKFRDFHLSVLGKERNIDRYRHLVERLGLKERVHFFGPQKEIASFYQMADALVIPSFYDPFANVTLEALSFGLFAVSSKTNGGHEILSDQNGAVIENLASPESIAAALDRVCRKTRASAEKIRASVKHLDFSNQLTKLIDACL